jgi:hypothetical protein
MASQKTRTLKFIDWITQSQEKSQNEKLSY